jgi:hypothetical protein
MFEDLEQIRFTAHDMYLQVSLWEVYHYIVMLRMIRWP